MRLTPIALLLSSPLTLAQLPNTVPPGYTSTEGPSESFLLGAWGSNQRAQLANDLFNGRASAVREFQLRQDGSLRGPHAVGRSWIGVVLSVAEVDYSRLSQTFANNPIATPTTVFSGPTTWPDLTTGPRSRPAPWGGGVNGTLRFPFSSIWIYTGAHGMLFDFTFTGGTLANRGTWGKSLKRYFLDGVSYRTSRGGSSTFYGIQNCVSSLSTYTIPDHISFDISTYAKKTGNPANDNTIQAYPIHCRSAPSKAHFGAIGPTGVKYNAKNGPFGTPIGACQPLLMVAPWIEFAYVTNSFGCWQGTRTIVPFNAALVGTEVYAQAAHDDKGVMHLSMGGVTHVRSQPANPKNYKMVINNDAASPTGATTQIQLPVTYLK